jgi:hypothetical protein
MALAYSLSADVARYKLRNCQHAVHFVSRRAVAVPKCNLFITYITKVRNVCALSAWTFKLVLI